MRDVSFPASAPVLAVRDMVLFPGIVVPLSVGRARSVQLIRHATIEQRPIVIVTQRHLEVDDVSPKDLYAVGTLCKIHQLFQMGDDTLRILVQGLERVRLSRYLQTEPFFIANLSLEPDQLQQSKTIRAQVQVLLHLLKSYGETIPGIPDEFMTLAINLEDPNKLAYLIAFNLPLKLTERQTILEAPSAEAKLRALSQMLQAELELHQLGTALQLRVQNSLTQSQRDYYLREQLKAIQQELGELDDRTAEVQDLQQKLSPLLMPADVRTEAERELKRLERLPPGSPEHTVIRSYLDWLVALPWGIYSHETLDTRQARAILDADHYDLEAIKQRIVEFLAVFHLQAERRGDPRPRGPILCLVGPPGVGKTSLGQSIARCLGRKFIRLSLGGIHDEAEIRGHRRTYIGAMPGRIIQAMMRAGTSNPVFMLDELDKLGGDFRGDPASALLEVLDPEQNHAFRDHYLDVPYDLSRVLFIATANLLDAIPAPLRDRMELLSLSGYTDAEKTVIAERYLIPKQLAEHALSARELRFSPEGIRALITEYTREAGVRGLEREISSLCRKAALGVMQGDWPKRGRNLTPSCIRDLLGSRRFFPESAEIHDRPGIAIGLAWTEVGGGILFIEATATPGSGQLRLTGKLGDVMRESAMAALSYVWSKAEDLGIPAGFFAQHDLHLHVPAGAIPKDGPSAGLAIAVAIASLATDRLVLPGVAMTGELTLRGRILPVGGIKEKVLAAHRAGLRTILLPHANQGDLSAIPRELLREMKLVLLEGVEDVFEQALGKPLNRQRRMIPPA